MVTNTKKKVVKKTKKKATKKKKASTVRKVGRPTKYDPAFCEIAREVMGKGYSKEAVSGHLGINKDTLYAWVEKYPEFSSAIKEGLELSRIFWEKVAIDNLTHSKNTKQLNSTSWIFNMKNRFGWKDKKEISADEETRKSFGFCLDEKPEEL